MTITILCITGPADGKRVEVSSDDEGRPRARTIEFPAMSEGLMRAHFDPHGNVLPEQDVVTRPLVYEIQKWGHPNNDTRPSYFATPESKSKQLSSRFLFELLLARYPHEHALDTEAAHERLLWALHNIAPPDLVRSILVVAGKTETPTN